MKVKAQGAYAEIICKYFIEQFPRIANISKTELLEILTDILVGTKETRYGPVPKPEQLVIIRDTIAKSISLNAPIPILIPWGGIKGDMKSSIDVAEVAAIRQLVHLDEQVKKFHAPGTHIHVRIEDLGARWLWRIDNIEDNIEKYSTDIKKLILMLRGDSSIETLRESYLMKAGSYFSISEGYSEIIESVIEHRLAYPNQDIIQSEEFKKLQASGWKGGLPDEQIAYYIDRYKELYPDLTMEHYVLKAADYLGGAKARYDLNGRGEPISSVESYLQLTFVPPIPGAPVSLFGNTVYHRTVPLSQARSHIAPWRAKGYLKVNGKTGLTKTKIVSWKDELLQSLIPSQVEFIDEKENSSVIVQADYLIEE